MANIFKSLILEKYGNFDTPKQIFRRTSTDFAGWLTFMSHKSKSSGVRVPLSNGLPDDDPLSEVHAIKFQTSKR